MDLFDILDILLETVLELLFHDKIPLPKGDLMNTPPEDTPFGVRPPEDIWEKMGVR